MFKKTRRETKMAHSLTAQRGQSLQRKAAAPEVRPPETEAQDAQGAEDEGPGLLASPAFWIGGILSIVAWIVIAVLFGAF
jgi:hypothetical protein